MTHKNSTIAPIRAALPERGRNTAIASFAPEHYTRLILRREDAADLSALPANNLVSGWSGGSTVLVKGEPAFIYGSIFDEGVGLIWAVTSPRTDRLGLLITRLARARIQALFNMGAHRVEAYCHRINRRSLRWLTRSLGFTVEGLMRRSGPNGQDRYMLSILPEEWRHKASAARCKRMLDARLGNVW